MAVFELESLKPLPERETYSLKKVHPLYCYKKLNGYKKLSDFVLTGGLRRNDN